MLGHSAARTAWAGKAVTGPRPLLRLPVAPLSPPPPPARAAAAVEGGGGPAAAPPAYAAAAAAAETDEEDPYTNNSGGRSRLAPARRVPIRQLPAAARLARDAARAEERARRRAEPAAAAAAAAAEPTEEPQQQRAAAATKKRKSGGGGGRNSKSSNNNTRGRPVPAAFTTQALSAAASKDPPDTQTLDAAEILFVNMALRRLGERRRLQPVRFLASYALARPDRNEHTCAAAFLALASCGRLDLAVAAWRDLAAVGVDVGPVGASALVKAAGVAGDAAAGVALLDELLRRRVTLNTAVYNALVHLCSLAGRPDDALAAYNLSRLDPDPACRPNCFTYSALLGGLVAAGRPEHGAELWRHIADDGAVKPDSVLWCQLIAAAGAAGDVHLARRLLDTMDGEAAASAAEWGRAAAAAGEREQEEGERGEVGGGGEAAALPSPADKSKAARAARRRYAAELSAGRAAAPAVNERHASALMAAFARCGDLDGCERAYRRLLVARGLPVDAHAASILLTAAARAGAPRVSLERVEALRADLAARGAPLNAHVGSALIGAYRSAAAGAEAQAKLAARKRRALAREEAAAAAEGEDGEQPPPAEQQQEEDDDQQEGDSAAETRREALRRALEVLERLRAERQANANAYTAAAAFCVQAGALPEAARLGRAMRREGVVLARPAIQSLARACIDAGLERPAVRMERLLESAEDEAYLEEEGMVMRIGLAGAKEREEEEEAAWRLEQQQRAAAAQAAAAQAAARGAGAGAAAAAARPRVAERPQLLPPPGQQQVPLSLAQVPLAQRRERRGAAAAAASQGTLSILIGLASGGGPAARRRRAAAAAGGGGGARDEQAGAAP